MMRFRWCPGGQLIIMHPEVLPPRLPGFPAIALKALVALVLSSAAVFADPVAVTTESLADIARYPERSAPATVVAMSQPRVSAEVPARIEAILPKPGDVVDRGAVLARLDCRDHALAREAEQERLAALAARIDLAERKLARSEKLAASQLQAADILDERRSLLVDLRAQKAAQEAALSRARYLEARCTVKAPARSLVVEWLASPGDYAVPGTPLVALIDLSSIELQADVYAPDAAELETSRPALGFEAASGGAWPVELRVVVGAIDPAARTREVRARFAAEDLALPGSAGRLVWRDSRPHLPANYLVERDGTPGVFVVEDERARFVPLPTAEVGRDTPVAIPLDSLVVVEGRFALTSGETVRQLPGQVTGASAGGRGDRGEGAGVGSKGIGGTAASP